MTISEDANAAADYIEQYGWIQGNYKDDDSGAVCMIGALALGDGNRACAMHGKQDKVYRDFLNVVDVPIWNDHLARTKEEVIQVLRDVAIKHQPDAMTSEGGNNAA